MEKCVACQFYDRNEPHSDDKGIRWGKCRRSGPMVHPVSAKSYMVEGIWPNVRDDDWCGEFAASKRRIDSPPTAAISSLMMQGATPPVRPSAASGASLMKPAAPAAASTSEMPPVPMASGRFGSD